MKLMSTGKDPLAVDPRTKGTPKPASDGSSNDNAPQFDGVLSDVGSDAKAAASADSAKKADPTSITVPAADASSPESTIMGALIDILGKGAGMTATQGVADVKGDAKAAKADPDTEGSDVVDSLLKKMAAKNSDPTDPPASATGAAAAPQTPTDMMSILLLGAGIQQAPAATQAAAGGAATAQAAATLGALDPSAKTPAAEPALSTGAQEMIVTNIAVSTHLAPAQIVPGKALLASGSATGPSGTRIAPSGTKTAPSGDIKAASFDDTVTAPSADTQTAQQGDTQSALPGDAKPAMPVGAEGMAPETTAVSAPAANPAHGQADDADAAGHAVEPSVSVATITPGAMSASLAPVRSIAAAIGELAAPAAPAAATPEAPKAAIGIARTMTLQMNPADLGTVDIRLHVTGQTLDVQLTISDSQTLGIVNRDRDALTSALHDQNYALNSLVIQDGGAAASSGGNNGTQGDSSGSNARADRQASGGAGSDTQGGGRQGSGADRPARDDRRPARDTPARAPVASESRAGSLYV